MPVEEDNSSDDGLPGRWIIHISLGQAITLPWMMEITRSVEVHEGRMVEAAPRAKEAEVREFAEAEGKVRFQLVVDGQPWSFEGMFAQGRVRGSIAIQNQLTLAWLERTKLKSMKNVNITVPALGQDEFER